MNTTADTSSFKLSITPFEGLYEQPYSYREWTADVVKTSLEYGKSQQFKKGVPLAVNASGWMLFVLIFGFGVLAFCRSFYRKRFSMLFASLLNWKLSKQIIRYENVYLHPVNILLTLNFLLCIPLFFSYFFYLKTGGNILLYYLFTFIPLLLYLLIKLIFYKFSAWLFNAKEAVEEYIFQTTLFNKYLGVVYLLLTTFLIYSSIKTELLYKTGITTLILFLAFQIVRGLIIGIERASNLFFIILYLCTLEILPWLVLGKWINNYL